MSYYVGQNPQYCEKAKLLDLTSGTCLVADGYWYNNGNFWLTTMHIGNLPEPVHNAEVNILYGDLHAKRLRYLEIPRDRNIPGPGGRFWLGEKE